MKTVKPGIRLKPNGKYFATKSIDGQRYYKEAATLREAELWRNKFHPVAQKEVTQKFILPTTLPSNEYVNGRDLTITVKEVYEKYLNGPLKMHGDYTQYQWPNRMNRFLPPIFSVRMADLTPEVLSELIKQAVMKADDTYGRCDFREELKILKAILNWYKDEKDFTFSVPITKYHGKMSEVKPRENRQKYLSLDEFVRFTEKLPPFERNLATIQFIYGLRIGEVCALTRDAVDFDAGIIRLHQVITWVKDIPKLKKTTKTEDEAELKMTAEAELILREQEDRMPSGCRYFFHHQGKMPRYRYIEDNYNEALLAAGIHHVTGTHFVRHTIGKISRKHGGLDASQAILRHKTVKMSEHYSVLDINEKASEVVIHAEKIFREARASSASKTEETRKVSAV
jgi:integrase